MLINKVVVGKAEIMQNTDENKKGPSVGYHSVIGKKTATAFNEYVIDRWGQARPLILVKYQP